MTALLAASLAALAVLACIVGGPLWRRRRRTRAAAARLPAAWRTYLGRQRLYRRVPAALRPRLEALVRVFLAEKHFVGCGGLVVSDTMRLAIALQACMLVLARSEHVFDELRSILVYPDEFVVREEFTEDGVVTSGERVLAGQSWDTSRIVLSWRDVRAAGDGYNVVIHEFAHYLDEEEGAANGAPLLDGPRDYARWALVMQRAFDELAAQAAAGTPTLLDPYGADSEAEFFAVASEAFFELPRPLRAAHADLYAELARFYRLDPASW